MTSVYQFSDQNCVHSAKHNFYAALDFFKFVVFLYFTTRFFDFFSLFLVDRFRLNFTLAEYSRFASFDAHRSMKQLHQFCLKFHPLTI